MSRIIICWLIYIRGVNTFMGSRDGAKKYMGKWDGGNFFMGNGDGQGKKYMGNGDGGEILWGSGDRTPLYPRIVPIKIWGMGMGVKFYGEVGIGPPLHPPSISNGTALVELCSQTLHILGQLSAPPPNQYQMEQP